MVERISLSKSITVTLVAVVLLICSFAAGLFLDHIGNGRRSQTRLTMHDLRPLQASAIASSCLLGYGLFSQPVRVQHVYDTNGEHVVTFHEANERVDLTEQDGWSESCAKVRIKSEDCIRIDSKTKRDVVLDPELMALERAVVLATTWASTMPGEGYDRYTVEAERAKDGRIVVFFENTPQTLGGHFTVSVSDRFVALGRGL